MVIGKNGNDLKVGGHVLIEVLSRHSRGETEKHHDELRPEYPLQQSSCLLYLSVQPITVDCVAERKMGTKFLAYG